MTNPEPASVVAGRPLLYDARPFGSNGEASCASCHTFGDKDELAWDLGNPDAAVSKNAIPIFGNAALLQLGLGRLRREDADQRHRECPGFPPDEGADDDAAPARAGLFRCDALARRPLRRRVRRQSVR
ncbi:MAG: hypothetical protein WDN69_27905 [Aliidongia sp.]